MFIFLLFAEYNLSDVQLDSSQTGMSMIPVKQECSTVYVLLT